MKELIEKNLVTNLNNLIAAIKLCIDNELIAPALMLLYSGIDIVGALERKPGIGTKASFLQWVDSYMLKSKPLHCSAIELYGARCGLLHTLAAQSDLSKSGKARQVIYASGSAKSKDLSTASRLLNRTDVVSVHVNELFDAFKNGLVSYFEEIDKDEARRSLVMKNAGIWLTYSPISILSNFLKVHEGK
jgi:hypothetical protein